MSKAKTKAVTPPAPKPATPPPPPAGWQHTPWTSFGALYAQNPEWFKTLADKTEHQDLWLATAKDPLSDEGKRITFVIFTAQLRYWKSRANKLDTDEGRKRERANLAKAIARAIKESSPVGDVTGHKFHSTLRSLGITSFTTPEDATDLRIISYDWQATGHDGNQLRDLFGYSESRFRTLLAVLKNLPQDHKAPPLLTKLRHKQLPRIAGPGAILLLHRWLQATARDRRTRVANGIWQFGKPSQQRLFFTHLHNVLIEAGARCEKE